jgi:hypothetical protein
MRFFGKEIHRIAFKPVLALFYFILLGPQLSHKFYFCANSPIRAFKYCHSQSTANGQLRPVASALSNVKRYFTLSIDKRYKFNDKFAIRLPEISLQYIYLLWRHEVYFRRPYTTSFIDIIHPLRGPPFV